MLLAILAVCHLFFSFNIISEFGEAGESWSFTQMYSKLQMWLASVGISLKTIYSVYHSYLNITFCWHLSFINNFRLYNFDKLVNKMTFYNVLWHLKMLSFLDWNLDISGFTYLSEFVQGLEFAAPSGNLYHLLSPLFCCCPVVMPTFTRPVPEPSLSSPHLGPHC